MASDEGALDLPIGDVADEPELSPSVVDTSGLTAEDFEKALKVLEAVQARPELISRSERKPLRMAVLKLAEQLTQKQFTTIPRRQYQEQKAKENKLERRARENRLKAADRKYINSVELRAQRLDALRQLMEPQVPFRPALMPPEEESKGLLPAPGEEGMEQQQQQQQQHQQQQEQEKPKIEDTLDEEELAWLKRRAANSDQVTGLNTPGAEQFIISPEKAPAEQKRSTAAEVVAEAEKLSRRQLKKKLAKAQAEAMHIPAGNKEEDEQPQQSQQQQQEQQEEERKKEETALVAETAEQQPKRILNYPRSCYVCKRRFVELHHWYDQLCPPCAALNWQKRNQVGANKSAALLYSLALIACA